MPHFKKFLRGHVRSVPGNMLVKFKVRSFNHFGAIIDRSSAHRHIERKQYLCHSLRSLGGDKYLRKNVLQNKLTQSIGLCSCCKEVFASQSTPHHHTVNCQSSEQITHNSSTGYKYAFDTVDLRQERHPACKKYCYNSVPVGSMLSRSQAEGHFHRRDVSLKLEGKAAYETITVFLTYHASTVSPVTLSCFSVLMLFVG